MAKSKIRSSLKKGQYGGYNVKISKVTEVERRSKHGQAESFLKTAIEAAEAGDAICCELIDVRNACAFRNLIAYRLKNHGPACIDVVQRNNKVYIDARSCTDKNPSI